MIKREILNNIEATRTDVYYVKALRRRRSPVKTLSLLTNRKEIILHHNNVWPHIPENAKYFPRDYV